MWIVYTYENPCELARFIDYTRSRIPQIFPSNKAFKNFLPRKVKKKTDFLTKPVFLVSCAPKKDISDFVLLATPRKTKDPRKKRPLLP